MYMMHMHEYCTCILRLQPSDVHELSALQLSGLSARERNRAKRKAKQMARRASKDTERRWGEMLVMQC